MFTFRQNSILEAYLYIHHSRTLEFKVTDKSHNDLIQYSGFNFIYIKFHPRICRINHGHITNQ